LDYGGGAAGDKTGKHISAGKTPYRYITTCT
jgi:hypothetical protein